MAMILGNRSEIGCYSREDAREKSILGTDFVCLRTGRTGGGVFIIRCESIYSPESAEKCPCARAWARATYNRTSAGAYRVIQSRASRDARDVMKDREIAWSHDRATVHHAIAVTQGRV